MHKRNKSEILFWHTSGVWSSLIKVTTSSLFRESIANFMRMTL